MARSDRAARLVTIDEGNTAHTHQPPMNMDSQTVTRADSNITDPITDMMILFLSFFIGIGRLSPK